MSLDISKAYEQFFYKTEAGSDFLLSISQLIEEAHANGEREPEHSRDFMQNARGVRSVLSLIQSKSAGVKKGKNPM